MASHTLTCIVLHRRDLGERDRIVTLLSMERGKLDAVAKGARRPGSKSSGASEVFTEARIEYADGRNLGIVTQWEIVRSYAALRSDLGLLARASYVCELTERLVDHNQPCPDTYDLLSAALTLLEMRHGQPDIIVHAFETRLLSERGYGLNLTACVRCGASCTEGRIALSARLGGLLCGRCAAAAEDRVWIEPETLETLRQLGSCSLEDLGRMALSGPVATQVDRCLRLCIQSCCEREIRSSHFLAMIRAGEG
jgi:DNA repair protein RecO (recombination protein O)